MVADPWHRDHIGVVPADGIRELVIDAAMKSRMKAHLVAFHVATLADEAAKCELWTSSETRGRN